MHVMGHISQCRRGFSRNHERTRYQGIGNVCRLLQPGTVSRFSTCNVQGAHLTSKPHIGHDLHCHVSSSVRFLAMSMAVSVSELLVLTIRCTQWGPGMGSVFRTHGSMLSELSDLIDVFWFVLSAWGFLVIIVIDSMRSDQKSAVVL